MALVSSVRQANQLTPFGAIYYSVSRNFAVDQLFNRNNGGDHGIVSPTSFWYFPFYARQVQNALLDVDQGIVEAAQSMGSSPIAIIFRVYLKEGLPDLIRVSIVTVISLIGLTTMAGAIGAGGLGDIAISIGYARFENDVTFVAMIIILILVFAVQLFGDWLVKSVTHH
ncbi:hypothetical protein TUA1478L_30720 [Lactiplantibacillus plantarum]